MKHWICPRCGGRRARRKAEDASGMRHPTCVHCGFRDYPGAKVAVDAFILQRGRILLARRAKPPRQGYWDIPGGFVHLHEAPERAVRREVREELGASFRPLRLLGAYSDTYFHQGIRSWVVCLSYLGEVTQEIRLLGDENVELRWFPLSRLPARLAFRHFAPAIRELRRQLRATSAPDRP